MTSGILSIDSGNCSLRLIDYGSGAGYNVTTDTKLVLIASAGSNPIVNLPADDLGFKKGLVVVFADDAEALTNPYLTLGIQRIK